MLRLDDNDISYNGAHACIDFLRGALALNSDKMDGATAMLCLTVNGVDSLPESYREYKDLIAPISYISSLRTED